MASTGAAITERRAELAALSATPIDEDIPAERLRSALSNPPFVAIPEFLNARDVGAFTPGHVAPGIIYRSGALDYIPPDQRALLGSQLGIRKIFDFRRSDELKSAPSEIEGIQLVSCPYKDGREQPVPLVLPDFATGEDGQLGVGYRKMYDDILDGYTTGYRLIFEALRDLKSGEAVLFHCTAGKDRTGVVSALILDLMDVPADTIGEEYALTRIGLEPFRERLLPVAIKSFKAYSVGTLDANVDLTSSQDGRPNIMITGVGVRELASSEAAIMTDFIGYMQSEYGGAEGYLVNRLGFSQAEVHEIRTKLRPASIGDRE